MESFKWVWKYLRHYKLLFGLGMILSTSTALINMINPYITGQLVDKVILGGNTGLLASMLAIMVGSVLSKAVIRYAYLLIFEFVSQRVAFMVRKEIYMKIQALDFNFFDRTKTGDIMARMTGDTDIVRYFVAYLLYGSFENVAIFFFGMVMLMLINVKFTLFLIAVTPFTAYFTFKLANTVKPAWAKIREQYSKLNSVVQENISGNRVVKAFAKEGYEIEKFTKENSNYKQANMNATMVWSKYLPIIDMLAATLSVITILAGGIFVINGVLTMGELVIFNSLIWAINGPMRMSGWIINDMQRFTASAEKIMTMLKTEPTIANVENPVKKDHVEGTVEFRNVTFSYGDEKVLEDISFKATPGETIGIIGPTGSGKSTIASLICRFYDCTEGEILIDGINVKNIEAKCLRSNIAVAMQDIFLFSDTIEGNIAFGDPHAPMSQVEWAAGVAGAHDFIQAFKESYDTIVGERGVGLSGGQKQRIALARALLKNPSVLILDDTTSSVDVETEHEIQKTLKSVYTDKTTFIIAHRISSVKNADQILVIENGKIAERGKHNDLMSKKGYYYSVYQTQLGNFEEKPEGDGILAG